MPDNDLKGIVEAKKTEKLAIDEHFKQSSAQKAHDVAVVMDALFSENGLYQKAVLTNEERFHILRCKAYIERFPSVLGANTLKSFLETSIAHKARGRDDVVNIVNTVLATQAPHGNNGLFDRLFGGMLKR